MLLYKKIMNRLKYSWAKTSEKRYENFLRKKGLKIGQRIWWCKVPTLDIDYSRPELVEIGDDVMINANVSIMTHDAASIVFRKLYKDFLPSSGAVIIGNNCYIGRYATILKGVTIGDNCIIGYGSLVTHDIPANSVAAGRPAKVICSIEDYYKKRKRESLSEAFAYAHRIVDVTGKKPTIGQMYEEFPFYLDGDKPDPGLKISVAHQTRGINEYWKEHHKAPFSSFDEFLKAAGIE